MSETLRKPLPVALVYGESESSQGLRRALGEIGADLVCDADIGSFSMDTLGASGADVVLISLDSILEDRLDEVYGALDEKRYRVMFDDPEISNKLDGWEHARWKRHLAAKLRDISDWDPPRPKNAMAVEVSIPADVVMLTEGESAEWMNEALSVLSETNTEHGDSDSFENQPGLAEALAPKPAADVETSNAQTLEQAGMNEPEDNAAVDADIDTSANDVSVAASPERSDTSIDDDAALQAELDALADSDDPLAALSALVGDQTSPGVASPADMILDDPTDGVGDADDDEVSAAMDALEASFDAGDTDLEFEIDQPVPLASQAEKIDSEVVAPDEDDSDWSSLEAELSAAFDSSTLGAIDAASDTSDEYSVDVPGGEQHASTSAFEPSDTEGQQLDASVVQASGEVNDTPTDEPPSALAGTPDIVAPSVTSAAADDPAGNGFVLPDVSQWALVDDYEPSTPKVEDPVKIEPAQDVAEGQQDGAEDEVDDNDDYGFDLELVDPIDYLKPEAPKDVSNELFNMPTLMPMAEAVAPKVGGEDEDESDSAQSGVRIKRVVVLGASIGGPDAVREFLSHLPQKLPACLVLVQHLGSEFVDLMVSQLSKSSALPVRIPGRAERAVHGEVLVVPSGCQIKLEPNGQLEISNLGGDGANNPSINLTMTMAAETFGAGATAIIFSGLAKDAAAGALEIASRGGEVWVQDPESCVVSNMVDEVVKAGVARFTGTPEALAHKLVAFLQEMDDE